MASRAEFSSLPIVIVSANNDATTIHKSLQFGASGFISKSTGIDDIRTRLQSVLEDEVWTPDGYHGSQEQDKDIAGLMNRLRTLSPQQSRVRGILN